MEPRKPTFRTLGLEIDFPFEPYGIQKAMIGPLVSTMMNSENCLIESPTGTGKTLVLLCSSLAWQKKSKILHQPYISTGLRKKNADERRERLQKRPCTCGRRPNQSDLEQLAEGKGNSKKGKEFSSDCAVAPNGVKLELSPCDEITSHKRLKSSEYYRENTKDGLQKSPYFGQNNKPDSTSDCIVIDSDDDCSIIIEEDQNKSANLKNSSLNTEKPKISKKQDQCVETCNGDESLCRSCAAIQADERLAEVLGEDSLDGEDYLYAKAKARIPRIYYGTRTHKQITQVIRELNKTSYKNELKMCILSSRDRTCINDEVKDSVNRNELCRDLNKNRSQNSALNSAKQKSGCSFYQDSNQLSQIYELVNAEYEDRCWDIEDITKFGRENCACPYYGVRSMQDHADITFCPYNYLLDPFIRNSLDINVKDAIVIFDEAHNIEDVCRDNASAIIDSIELDDFINELNTACRQLVQGSDLRDTYEFFRDKFQQLKVKLRTHTFTDDKNGRFNDAILTNDGMVGFLTSIGLGPGDLEKVKKNFSALRKDDDKKDDQTDLSFVQMQFLSQIKTIFDFMFSNSGKNINDYRIVLAKQPISDTRHAKNFRSRNSNEMQNQPEHVWQLSLLCMNPGVAFEKIQNMAWSVIVASGTLTPLESLKSELGCSFWKAFTGAHVIKEDRVFATILGHGPKRVDLNCSFMNSLKLDFQDEVGQIVRDTCSTIPNGVLCFFPSYDRMECFYQRWVTKGFINTTTIAGKKLFRERKKLSVSEFEIELENYNKHARMKGAVLFAVFRGKVSEGIDFADEAARAVITIGIPYPNIKERNVGLKKEYNDGARKKRPELMSGSDWYATQAFRALNQALGRCIRHKDDWGAIIMIDSRLKDNRAMDKISKWLRTGLVLSNSYPDIQDRLKEFVQRL